MYVLRTLDGFVAHDRVLMAVPPEVAGRRRRSDGTRPWLGRAIVREGARRRAGTTRPDPILNPPASHLQGGVGTSWLRPRRSPGTKFGEYGLVSERRTARGLRSAGAPWRTPGSAPTADARARRRAGGSTPARER